MRWRKAAWAGGWTTTDEGGHRWTVRRAPSFRLVAGRPVIRFWVYRDGHRYTPTGRYDDAVSFGSAAEARAFAEAREEAR